jgi:hypothetical protein
LLSSLLRIAEMNKKFLSPLAYGFVIAAASIVPSAVHAQAQGDTTQVGAAHDSMVTPMPAPATTPEQGKGDSSSVGVSRDSAVVSADSTKAKKESAVTDSTTTTDSTATGDKKKP